MMVLKIYHVLFCFKSNLSLYDTPLSIRSELWPQQRQDLQKINLALGSEIREV